MKNSLWVAVFALGFIGAMAGMEPIKKIRVELVQKFLSEESLSPEDSLLPADLSYLSLTEENKPILGKLLIWASAKGRADIVVQLLQKFLSEETLSPADLSYLSLLPLTEENKPILGKLLIWALAKGRADIVVQLLQKFLFEETLSPADLSYLSLLPLTEENKPILGELLIWASAKGRADIVVQLLRKGVSTEPYKKGSFTALMAAAQKGHENIVDFLLQCQADPNAQDENGDTALTIIFKEASQLQAIRKASQLRENRTTDVEMVIYLLKRITGDFSFTEIVRCLIEAGANINFQDKQGNTPLMLAINQGYTATAKLLIKKGANTNLKNCHDFTALLLAVKKNNKKIVKLLVKNPETDYKSENYSPEFVARGEGHFEVLEILENREKSINSNTSQKPAGAP